MIPHLYLYADDWRAMDVNDGFAGSWVWRWLPEHCSGTVLLVLLACLSIIVHGDPLGTTRHYAARRDKSTEGRGMTRRTWLVTWHDSSFFSVDLADLASHSTRRGVSATSLGDITE